MEENKDKLITLEGLSVFKDKMVEYIDEHEVDVDIATSDTAGIVMPDGTSTTVNESGVLSAIEKMVEITQAQYDALSDAEKNNGKTYFITDSEESINASCIVYDNTDSGLTAVRVQDAIDEIVEKAGNSVWFGTTSEAQQAVASGEITEKTLVVITDDN